MFPPQTVLRNQHIIEHGVRKGCTESDLLCLYEQVLAHTALTGRQVIYSVSYKKQMLAKFLLSDCVNG